MELRKKYVMRRNGEDTAAILVRDSGGRVWIETAGGEAITDAVVIDRGRTSSRRPQPSRSERVRAPASSGPRCPAW